MYEDRTTAGTLLTERLLDRDINPDVVLAVPPGGVNAARPIVDRFDATLGLLVSEPIRSPTEGHPVGAITDTGVMWVDDRLVRAFDIGEEKLEIETQRAFREARNKHEVYDSIDEDPTPTGVVAIVDDGIVNTMTVRATVSAIDQVPEALSVVAAPVGTPDAVTEARAAADEAVVPQTVQDSKLFNELYDHFDRPVVEPTG